MMHSQTDHKPVSQWWPGPVDFIHRVLVIYDCNCPSETVKVKMAKGEKDETAQ